MITKLNSRVSLLKRAKKYLNLSLRTLLYRQSFIMQNIIYGKCPEFFNYYICFVNNRHHDTTRAPTNMDRLATPLFNTKTGKCSLFATASGTRLKNNQDNEYYEGPHSPL